MTDMIRLMVSASEECASVLIPEGGYGFSADWRAILAPTLHVSSAVVRAVSHGSTLFKQLSNLRALHCIGRYARWERGTFTFCWGDLEVFETGRPIVRNAILMQDVGDVPDLTRVMQYVGELKTLKIAV